MTGSSDLLNTFRTSPVQSLGMEFKAEAENRVITSSERWLPGNHGNKSGDLHSRLTRAGPVRAGARDLTGCQITNLSRGARDFGHVVRVRVSRWGRLAG